MRTQGHQGVHQGLGGIKRIFEDTARRRFGTVRLKEAEVLTAEMTANVTNLGGHQRTKAEWESLVSISGGCWRTLADGRPAVFKTVCSFENPSAAHSSLYMCRSRYMCRFRLRFAVDNLLPLVARLARPLYMWPVGSGADNHAT